MPKTEDKTPEEVEVSSKVSAFLAGEQPRIISSDGTSEQIVQPYFRASMHTEQLKHNIATKSRQLILGEDMVSLEAVSYGLDLTESQDRALHAIQKLLAASNYQGDGQIPLESADFKIYGSFLPYLSMSWTDYYQAYGLEPAGDGAYHGAQVRQAREALDSLTEMRWMSYKKLSGKYDKDGEPLWHFIRVKKPLIQLQYGDSYHDITEEDIQKILSGQKLTEDKENNRRVTRILLLPSPILIDEIDRYYLLKPAGLHDEVKALYGGKKYSGYITGFISFLLMADIPVMKIGKETLAEAINMDSLIENRQKSRIEKRIQEALEAAKKLGYLLDYEEQSTGLLILKLNPERCSRVRAKLARKKRVKKKETE